MISVKMIENEEDLFCSQNHKLPVLMIICETHLQRNQRLLCQECIDNLEQKAQTIGFKKVLQNINENQKLKKESVENLIMINIKLIEQLQKEFDLLKSNVLQKIDQLTNSMDEWIENLKVIGQQEVTYSFFDQLEILIKQVKFDEFDEKPLIDDISNINKSWKSKIIKNLNLFKSFEGSKKCEQLLNNLENIKIINECIIQQNQMQENKDININLKQNLLETNERQLEQQLIMYEQTKFILIDDSNKQSNTCYAIAFDQTGSIMISCDSKIIKIWNFEQGRLKLINTYSAHTEDVACLVYSKQQNNFISGSFDNSIICWQQINQRDWKFSKQFKQHSHYVFCLILNKEEDQLVSGGLDQSIKVWKVDFKKNELAFLFSLDQHSNFVLSLSFNSSETLLASCGLREFIIWQKDIQGKWEFKYKKKVKENGYNLHFINDQQFIWVTSSQNIDHILVFEQKNGVFKKNSNKTIKLNQNHEFEDQGAFPIIFDKDRSMLFVRHKNHIYLIKKLNDGTFKIVESLKCRREYIFGTITNDGKYLVFWNDEEKKYYQYEIIYK